jgi:hypothetical protein
MKLLLVACVRMHPFEMREDDIPVEGVTMGNSSVLNHGVRDGVLVVTDELEATAGTDLFI